MIRHLEWVDRGIPRRAVGCSDLILLGNDTKLTAEIAQYEATGHLIAGDTTEHGQSADTAWAGLMKRERRFSADATQRPSGNVLALVLQAR